LSGYLEDAYVKWLGSSLACCGTLEKPPVRGEYLGLGHTRATTSNRHRCREAHED
jgi:hypothetical protein